MTDTSTTTNTDTDRATERERLKTNIAESQRMGLNGAVKHYESRLEALAEPPAESGAGVLEEAAGLVAQRLEESDDDLDSVLSDLRKTLEKEREASESRLAAGVDVGVGP